MASALRPIDPDRLRAAAAFVRSVVEGAFGQTISDAEVRRVADKVVKATELKDWRR